VNDIETQRMEPTYLLVVCILVIVIANVMITIRLSVDMRALATRDLTPPPLPCGAVPTRFVMEEPECADKLLRFMNVTNVRVLSSKGLDAVWMEPAVRGGWNVSE